jgi:uncharacterized repeat protein (TIGR04138 family)
MAEKNPLDRIRALVKRDPTFRVEAYCYVFEALDHTLRGLDKPRHVTGQELCHGIRQLAIDRFGPLARTVFRHWGITRTEDFGRIVFNLIDAELMGKTDTDSLDDFRDVYDFEDVFERSLKIEAKLP